MDGKRIKAFYANATAWSFDSDAEPHIVAARERQAAEFDAWLAETVRAAKAEAWDEGEADGRHNAIEHRPGMKFTNPYLEDDRHVDQ